MTRKELKEKISEISNSEFPLIDFFNDIDWLDDRHFNTEKAYEDIEKIYNVFVYYKDKVKKTEKELKQTKLNFKNSQIHSKNCYKKLKEKYTRLERAYKNNEVMTRDLNELINRNLELKKDYELLDEDYDQLFAKFLDCKIENQKLKQAIKILESKFKFELGVSVVKERYCYSLEFLFNNSYFSITKVEYELLKEVFESVGGKNAKD